MRKLLALSAASILATATAHAAIVTHSESASWSGAIPDYDPGHEFDFTPWAPPPGDNVLSIAFHWAGSIYDPPGSSSRLYLEPFSVDGNDLQITGIDFGAFLATPYVGLGPVLPADAPPYVWPLADGVMTMTVTYDPPEGVPEPASLLVLAVGLLGMAYMRQIAN